MRKRASKEDSYARIGRLSRWLARASCPVFVVGTGRCGSSLLVRVLESHPGTIVYPTEANDLWHPHSYPFSEATRPTPPIVEDPRRFTAQSLDDWPPGHEARIKDILRGFHLRKGLRRVLVIKSAMLSFMLPRLLEMYPRARFVHIYRIGPAVVESFIQKEWAEKYATRFTEPEYRRHVATYWRECLLEIERVRNELLESGRDAWHDIRYESLCEDPHDEIRQLARFLGVPPDGFEFDLDTVQSRNFKVGDYSADPAWTELLEVMEPAMKLKGYA